MAATSEEDGRLQLRIDAGAVALDMPVDHDTTATVADVPLRHQVLIPGAELLGVGGTCRRALAPDARMAGTQCGVDDLRDRLAQALARDEAPAHIEQLPVGEIILACRHALETGVGADPVQAQQQPFLKCRTREVFVVSDGAEGIGEADAQISFFQHVEQAGHWPAPADFGLERGEAFRVFLLFQRCQRNPPAAALEDANIGVGGQAGIERRERLGHLCLHACNEGVGIPGKSEGGIVFVPSDLEVRRQILVGIAIAIGAFDPDFLATQLLAQRLQRANLVGDPVDPGPSLGVAFDHGFTPRDRYDTIERYGFLKRIAVQFAVEVATYQGECIQHRPVILVVGAECQSAEHDRQHAAVVRAVGAADHRLEVVAVHWPGGFALGDQIAQGLLINDGKDNRADCIVRLGQARRGELEQQRRLAGNALEVSDQLVLDPFLRRGADAMDGSDQQIDQRVGDLASAHMAKGCKQRQSDRRRMAAQLVQFLGRDTAPVCQQNLGRKVGEQVWGQCKRTDTGELVGFLADALQAGLAGASAQCEQWSTIILAACRVGMRRREQGIELRRRRRRQTRHQAFAPRLFVPVDDGAYQSIEAVRRWWLDAKRPAPLACSHQQSIWPMFQRGHLAFQPTRESVGIVQRGLAKAEGSRGFVPGDTWRPGCASHSHAKLLPAPRSGWQSPRPPRREPPQGGTEIDH